MILFHLLKSLTNNIDMCMNTGTSKIYDLGGGRLKLMRIAP